VPQDIAGPARSTPAPTPGIGPSLSKRIVEFREKNGPYATVDDLLKVQGIGEKSLSHLREYLTAREAAEEVAAGARGATLVETIVALAVGAVLVAMAVPSLSGLLARRSVDAAAATIAGELARARQDAIARRRYVGVVFEIVAGRRFASRSTSTAARRGSGRRRSRRGVDELLRGPGRISARATNDVRLAIPGPERSRRCRRAGACSTRG